MKIAVIGLGYVGSVGCACLAELGHQVIGVDIDRNKVDRLNDGRSSIIEVGLDALLERHTRSGRLRATDAIADAVLDADIAFIAVGTPGLPSGEPDLRPLHTVCRDLSAELGRRASSRPLAVVVRSTVPPGTMRGIVIPALAGDRYEHGKDFLVGSNPEFLREGSAVSDFMHASFTLLGSDLPCCLEIMRTVYAALPAEVLETDLESAELVKYGSNAFHALKVCFANEIGTIANELGADGRKVMELFCRDRVLNISPRYLQPGFSYGGSCLPKDVRALNAIGRKLHVELPVLASIPRSNDAHTQRGLDLIERTGCKNVSLLGLAFKRGTADLRSSPMLYLHQHLVARQYELAVHDEDVTMALEKGLYEPQEAERFASHLVDLEEAIRHAEVIVIGKTSDRYSDLSDRLSPGQVLIDLAGQFSERPRHSAYFGSCWANPAPQADRIAEALNASIKSAQESEPPRRTAGLD